VDQLGNERPVITLGFSDYTMEAIAYGRRLSKRIFQRLGVEDRTSYDPSAVGSMSHQGEPYVLRGGNHWAGTHLMGTTPANSVVNARQRSWDHENLYLAGAGSMPSIGSSNTTLTISALCFMSAEAILEDLQDASAALELQPARGVA
jgi:choline dehydrogenase-like flavoprotein